MADAEELKCSRKCQYLFFECDADETRPGECRAYYNECVEACVETWPAPARTVSDQPSIGHD